jgi:hypothetical protein
VEGAWHFGSTGRGPIRAHGYSSNVPKSRADKLRTGDWCVPGASVLIPLPLLPGPILLASCRYKLSTSDLREFLAWVAGSVHCTHDRDSSSVDGGVAGLKGLTVSEIDQKRSTTKNWHGLLGLCLPVRRRPWSTWPATGELAFNCRQFLCDHRGRNGSSSHRRVRRSWLRSQGSSRGRPRRWVLAFPEGAGGWRPCGRCGRARRGGSGGTGIRPERGHSNLFPWSAKRGVG